MKINCDLGEGLDAVDKLLIPLVDQASIACGAHAGSEASIRRCVKLAKLHHTEIGIHPSYPDRANFGRRSVNIPLGELETSLRKQIGDFLAICASENTHARYVKAHGALYNDIAKDAALRTFFIELIAAINSEYAQTLALMLPATLDTTELRAFAKQQTLTVIFEAFADRAYTAEGHLVSRQAAHAVHNASQTIVAQYESLSSNEKVRSEDGSWLSIKADSLCFHGDNTASIEAIKTIKDSAAKNRMELNNVLERNNVIELIGENAVLISFSKKIESHLPILIADANFYLSNALKKYLTDSVPSYTSLLLYFEEMKIAPNDFVSLVDRSLHNWQAEQGSARKRFSQTRLIEIPVYYAEEVGPDLSKIAAEHDLDIPEVIRLHHSTSYSVFTLGFSPGFAYMGMVDSRIASARLAEPRKHVAKGSVGIAETQTGVYPNTSPGGWNIIGRTPLTLAQIDANGELICPFHAGDRVRFIPISRDDFIAQGGELG